MRCSCRAKLLIVDMVGTMYYFVCEERLLNSADWSVGQCCGGTMGFRNLGFFLPQFIFKHSTDRTVEGFHSKTAGHLGEGQLVGASPSWHQVLHRRGDLFPFHEAKEYSQQHGVSFNKRNQLQNSSILLLGGRMDGREVSRRAS